MNPEGHGSRDVRIGLGSGHPGCPLARLFVPQAEVKRHAITCATLNDIVQSLFDEFSDCRHGAFRCTGDFRK
jgi:hypothetical protein